ncbi:MAG: hypothetical protein ACOZBL_02735 [Patescibacteria group bacterium]
MTKFFKLILNKTKKGFITSKIVTPRGLVPGQNSTCIHILFF